MDIEFILIFYRNLYFYLDALSQKDWESSKKFHGYIVGLYADYDPDKLLPFLKASDHYPIQEALGTSINNVMDTTPTKSQYDINIQSERAYVISNFLGKGGSLDKNRKVL